MGVGVTAQHEELGRSVRAWAERHVGAGGIRAGVDEDTLRHAVPAWWKALTATGWLGVGIPTEHGGDGGDVLDLAVLVEALGASLVGGPVLATLVAGAAIAYGGDAAQRRRWLPGLASGGTLAGIGVSPARIEASEDAPYLMVSGTIAPACGSAASSLWVLPLVAGADRAARWCVVEPGDGLTAAPLSPFDLGRPSAAVSLARVRLSDAVVLREADPGPVVTALLAADAAGVASWCLEHAAGHARTRRQFGRPIGQFQGVKHRVATMAVAVEQARAAVWDAARALDERGVAPLEGREDDDTPSLAVAVAVAGALAIGGCVDVGEDCVQVLGGVGYTWEDDAHLALRRLVSLEQLAGPGARHRARLATLTLAGARRPAAVSARIAGTDDASHTALRAQVRAAIESASVLERSERRRVLADAGIVEPHLPRPWGLGAGPLGQLVVEEELRRAGLERPRLGIGAWAIGTLLSHGSPEQVERWVGPTLRGELRWCQLFSEPDAGSDLGSLVTRAMRAEAGWRITGHKIWTSRADLADLGMCLARTDADAPKHRGLTYFVVDMRARGVEVRPLRDLTGGAAFGEVLLDDVLVGESAVVGEVGDGWRAARTTLEVERVSMGSGTLDRSVEELVALVRERPVPPDPLVLDRLGAVVAQAQSVALFDLRSTVRALEGTRAASEASVRKLVLAYGQACRRFGLELLAPAAAADEGDVGRWGRAYLASRGLTIGGGTTEVLRNVLAERHLGLPRDP